MGAAKALFCVLKSLASAAIHEERSTSNSSARSKETEARKAGGKRGEKSEKGIGSTISSACAMAFFRIEIRKRLTGDHKVGTVGRLGGLFRGALGLGFLCVGRAQGPGEDEQGQQREGCGAVGLHDRFFWKKREKSGLLYFDCDAADEKKTKKTLFMNRREKRASVARGEVFLAPPLPSVADDDDGVLHGAVR